MLDIQVVVNINPTAQHDLCDSMILSASSKHTVTVSKQPNGLVQPNIQNHGTWYVRVRYLRTTSMTLSNKRASITIQRRHPRTGILKIIGAES